MLDVAEGFEQVGPLRQRVGHQNFASRYARQRRGDIAHAHRLQPHLASRHVEPSEAERALSLGDGGEIVVPAGIEQAVLGERAGRDDAHDVALDHRVRAPLARRRRVFQLLANGDPVAARDQPMKILFRRVHRHARHRDIAAQMLASLGQRDIQGRGRYHCIVEEQLVEIPHPVKQQAVSVGALDPPILIHHRRGTAGALRRADLARSIRGL